jgi:hypothetical protein
VWSGPGRGPHHSKRWSYSSARLCWQGNADGTANWWCRYLPKKIRGTYAFKASFQGDASRAAVYSPNIVYVTVKQECVYNSQRRFGPGPADRSRGVHGPLTQRESASFTRMKSLVQIQYGPPACMTKDRSLGGPVLLRIGFWWY